MNYCLDVGYYDTAFTYRNVVARGWCADLSGCIARMALGLVTSRGAYAYRLSRSLYGSDSSFNVTTVFPLEVRKI